MAFIQKLMDGVIDNLKTMWPKLNSNFENLNNELAEHAAADVAINQRLDTILQGNSETKDPELTDIQYPDPSYTPDREINSAGDMTRDMQKKFSEQLADVAQANMQVVINIKSPPHPLTPAIGDGSDEITTLTAIFDYIDSIGGGTVKFTDGIYGVSSPINIPSNTTLEYSGNAWIKALAPMPHLLYIGGDRENIKAYNPQLDCNNQAGINGIGIGGNPLSSGIITKDIIIDGGIIKNAVCQPDSESLNAGGGKGVMTERGVLNAKINNITVKNCTYGLGSQGDTVNIAEAVEYNNCYVEECMIGLFSISLDDGGDPIRGNTPDGFDCSFNNIKLKNCGLSNSEYYTGSGTPTGLDGGVIVLERSKFNSFNNIICINSSSYGKIGGFIRGSGKNVKFNNLTFYGDAKALYYHRPAENLLPITAALFDIQSSSNEVNTLIHKGTIDYVLCSEYSYANLLVYFNLNNISIEGVTIKMLETISMFRSDSKASIINITTQEIIEATFNTIYSYLNTFLGSNVERRANRLETRGSVNISHGRWDSGHLELGVYHIWIDMSGRLRIKNSAPTSDTDGTIVGTQS